MLNSLKTLLDASDLIKSAADKEHVKSHFRKVDDKVIYISEHDREAGEASNIKSIEAERLLREKQAKEIALWQSWVDSGYSSKELQPLLDSFKPMIMKKVNIYKNQVKIPPDAIELEFKIRFVQGLRSYDPSKGSLGTYIFKYLEKGKRFITEHQNIARIPENRIYKIKEYKDAVSDLAEQLGRLPDEAEVADKLEWSVEEVERMSSEMRADKITEGFEDDPYSFMPSKSTEVLKLFKYELEGQERELYEYLSGLGKPQITSTSDLSAKLNVPDYQISRMKSSIEKKLKKYL